MAVIHPPSDLTKKPYACVKPCEKCFARRHDLLRHYKVHLTGDAREKELVYCPFFGCSSHDFQRSNIKSHIKTKHRRQKHLVCLKCKKFWIAADSAALAEHDTTIHGVIPPPQRQQREDYPTIGSKGINNTVASASNPPHHQRNAAVHHRAVYDTKHNSSGALPPPPTPPAFKASSANIQVDRRQSSCFSSHTSTPCHLPSLSEVLRQLGYRPIDEQSPPASPRSEAPCELFQWITIIPSPAAPTSDTRDYKVKFNADKVVTRHSDCGLTVPWVLND
ncbi:hypothetical protein F5146DRAFT_1223036 [Armillaria mellea]|nr:hypothetical protein F5146DRAFT_1223036 [Armillaria mellea]